MNTERLHTLPRIAAYVWPLAYVVGIFDILLVLFWTSSGTSYSAEPLPSPPLNDISTAIGTAEAQAMQAKDTSNGAQTAQQAVMVVAAVKAVTMSSIAQPPPPVVAPAIAPTGTSSAGTTNAANAFTPDWYRCVILPESSNRAWVTSGLFGILTSTWHDYGMPGVPGAYSANTQAMVALEIYARNGGFGPPAWNNHALCDKFG